MKRITTLLLITLTTIFHAWAKPMFCSSAFTVTIDGATAAFNGEATGVSPYFSWDFGDGTYGSGEDVIHTYSDNGLYLVCLSVITADSCFSVSCDSIYIDGAGGGVDSGECSAAFTWFETFGAVYFTDASDDGGADDIYWQWNFGDGSISDAENPVHTYLPGTYEVCLTIYTSDSCSSMFCDLVTVGGGIDSMSCSAGFVFDTDDDMAYFENTSTGGGADIVSYWWSFGDGTYSDAENPSHLYADDDVYFVCLTIYTADSCTSTYCSEVIIGGGGGGIDSLLCAAEYEFTVSGTEVDFVNTSDGGGADIWTYYWEFGDGGTSYEEDPTHIFAFEGVFEVCLTIFTSDSCSSTYCQPVDITDGDTTGVCNAFFEYDFGITPWGIFTTNLSDDGGAPTMTYSWDFGDGGTSTEFEPVHEYAIGGSYNVCLTVTTPTCSDTYCLVVDIAAATDDILLGGLVVTPNPAHDNVQIQFSSTETSLAQMYVADLTGKQIYALSSEPVQTGFNAIQIETSTWESGMYMIHIQLADGSIASEKILVVH